MSLYARIADGRVAEPMVDYDGPITDLFHADQGWIDVTAVKPQPVEGWTTADGGKTFAPPVMPVPVLVPRTASAKQIRYALNDLGVRAAWNAAVTAASQSAQDYWTSADPMIEDNAKIAKWCVAAGITPKALFDKAITE